MEGKTKIKVKIISDIICPWCFIRTRQLREAIKQMESKVEVEQFFSPYLLLSTIPDEGMGYVQYFKAQDYGDYNMDQIEDIYKEAITLAKAHQINMQSPKQLKVYRNTIKCHRAAEYVLAKYGSQVQTKLYEEF